ncbi:hypothetical protein [Dryocola clanedunensis]
MTMTVKQLIAEIKGRGTTLLERDACPKCGECNHYYAKQSGVKNGCVWCMYKAGRTPKSIIETLEVKADGTSIYHGKRCRNCGSTERLSDAVFGAKVGACYACSLAKASEKIATTQVNRLHQKLKTQANKFIINSIDRSGAIDVAPTSIGEYYEVRALVAKIDRFNKIEADNGSGVVWELGHKFPASGGESEWRGKAIASNLYLVRRDENRQQGDELPDNWSSEQVIWVGDIVSSVDSYNAGKLWQERMGWSAMSKAQKSNQKQRESDNNEQHYVAMSPLLASIVDELANADEADWQSLYDDMSLRLEKLQNRMSNIALKNGKAGVDMWQSEGGLIEEALHGVNARVRVVHNTMSQLMDCVDSTVSKSSMDDDSYCSFLTSVALVKQAVLMWARDVLANPKRDIQGFTHPLLSEIAANESWGCEVGVDGRHWLCGWKARPTYDEQYSPLDLNRPAEVVDVREGRNAEYVRRSYREWQEDQQRRIGNITEQMLELMDGVRAYRENLPSNTEIEGHQQGESSFNYQCRLCVNWLKEKDIHNRLMNVNNALSNASGWLDGMLKGKCSASDIERASGEYIARLNQYQGDPVIEEPSELMVLTSLKSREFQSWISPF